MEDRWDHREAGALDGALGECVYGSRLIGADASLVLHGGGNTSVKAPWLDVTGEDIGAIYVKGSGWDLATIEAGGFAPLDLARLRRLLEVDSLSDSQMMAALSAARLDSSAPQPSVEALLHALLPHPAVLHSHADVIVTLTNHVDGEARAREALGHGVLVVPYVMPGFLLAKEVARRLADEPAEPTSIVLLHHGLFTFGATTREAYADHIELISRAERWLDARAAVCPPDTPLPPADHHAVADLRRAISGAAGRPMIVRRHADVARFASRPNLVSLTGRGPLTPDHVIRTKRVPMVGLDLDAYVAEYQAYVEKHADRVQGELVPIDPAPRVVIDRHLGLLTVGRTANDAAIAADIYRHTIEVLERTEVDDGGYRGLPPEDIFDVEYWELEQAKLRLGGSPPALAGQIALVTGAASGIGWACAAELLRLGAAVIGFDASDSIGHAFGGSSWLGVHGDVTDTAAVAAALAAGVERFGGVDLVVVCAGIFGESRAVAELDEGEWRRVMAVNLDAVAAMLPLVHPLLTRSPAAPAVALVVSKNVAAPGREAAAYSTSKAGLTQLARVTALEWAADGIRVNCVHPDAVFDTGLWSDDLIAARAASYGLSPEAYKRRNLLGIEITSADVARAVVALCSDTFVATTGAQVPIDGGSDRVI